MDDASRDKGQLLFCTTIYRYTWTNKIEEDVRVRITVAAEYR
jgi:hypothetical protein